MYPEAGISWAVGWEREGYGAQEEHWGWTQRVYGGGHHGEVFVQHYGGRRAAVSLRPWLGVGMTGRSFFTKLTPRSDHPLLHTEKTLPKP